MTAEPYRLSDFCSAELPDKPCYEIEEIAFDHVLALHRADEIPLVWHGRCGSTVDAWAFVHTDGYRFAIWVYEADGKMRSDTEWLWPIIMFEGTAEDGLSLTFAAPSPNAEVSVIIAAMQWVVRETEARGWGAGRDAGVSVIGLDE